MLKHDRVLGREGDAVRFTGTGSGSVGSRSSDLKIIFSQNCSHAFRSVLLSSSVSSLCFKLCVNAALYSQSARVCVLRVLAYMIE